MCHRNTPIKNRAREALVSDDDFADPDLGELLSMPLLLAIPLPPLPLEDDDLVRLSVTKHLSLHRRTVHHGRADRDLVPVRRQKDLSERDGVPWFGVEGRYAEPAGRRSVHRARANAAE